LTVRDHNNRFRRLRYFIVAILIVLTIQGWTGDFTNLFATFPSGSFGSFPLNVFSALGASGALPLYHGLEGLFLGGFSLIVLGLSIRSKKRSIILCAILALSAIFSAMIGGVLFVLSNFQNNAFSAQMGGSFIGAYAFYFMELYFTKTSQFCGEN